MPRKPNNDGRKLRKRRMSTEELKSYAADMERSAQKIVDTVAGLDEIDIDGAGLVERALRQVEKFIPKLIGAAESERMRHRRDGGGSAMAW